MGTFSIWHWIIVLVVFVVMFGIPFIAVATERSNKTIGRGKLALWVIVYWLLGSVVLGVLAALVTGDEGMAEVVGGGYAYLAAFFVYWRVVRRTRDAGMTKLPAYLACIPVIGLLVLIWLMFVGSASDRGQPEAEVSST